MDIYSEVISNTAMSSNFINTLYMVKKTFKNLLRNRWTDGHETLYVASGTLAHHSYDDPGLTLTYFTARSNFVTWGFSIKKGKLWTFQKLLQPVT